MRLKKLRWAICLIGLAALAAPQPASALPSGEDTVKVPIDRILANLERQLLANSNDVATVYALGRIHSMAFVNETTVDVKVVKEPGEVTALGQPYFGDRDTGIPSGVGKMTNSSPINAVAQAHLTNAVFLYQRAARLLNQGTNATAREWLLPPVQLGLAWNLEQAQRRPEAIQAYREALAKAWHWEAGFDSPSREQLAWSWYQLRHLRNPLSRPTHFLGSGFVFSEEIIDYLLPLLDPVKDAREIAKLQSYRAKLLRGRRVFSPILVPLAAGTPFAELVNPTADVPFDLDGSGLLKRWGWITPRAAWLVYDADGSGQITSGLQLFGNVTFYVFWRDGYAALTALDDNGDGRLTGAELQHLALWRDANSNGICDPGEVRPLADYGITALECAGQTDSAGMVFHPTGVRFQDGTTRPTYDWLAPLTGAPVRVQ